MTAKDDPPAKGVQQAAQPSVQDRETEPRQAALSEAEESLLLGLQEAVQYSDLGEPARITQLAQLTGIAEKDCERVARELSVQGLVKFTDFGAGQSLSNSAVLTAKGREATYNDLAAVAPLGRVTEIAQDLEELPREILDAVVRQQLRLGGTSNSRSQVRTAVRNKLLPKPEIPTVNTAIDRLVGTHLTQIGTDDPSYQVTPAGLLSSQWGENALQVLDVVWKQLELMQQEGPVLQRYSWSSIQRASTLPKKAFNLVYLAIAAAGLGKGPYRDEGDKWWIAPRDPDVLLDKHGSVLEYLRTLVSTIAEPSEPIVTTPAATDQEQKTVISAMQEPDGDPQKVFIIHGRNIEARNAIEQFVNSLGLKVLDFDQVSANLGGSVFVGEVVRAGLQLAHGIIALFTPDEVAALHPTWRGNLERPEEVQRWQARPNVIFEAGMAYGLAQKRTVLVTLGTEVSLFSDVAGIHVIRLDNQVENRKKLRLKLIGMNCSVDKDAHAWTDPKRSGDFEACVSGLSGVSPPDPFAETDGAVGGQAPVPSGVVDTPVVREIPGVSVEISYKKLPSSDGDIHHYELAAVLKNRSTSRLNDWYLEVDLPTALLEPQMPYGTRVRSEGEVTLFRTSTDLKPILAGGILLEAAIPSRRRAFSHSSRRFRSMGSERSRVCGRQTR